MPSHLPAAMPGLALCAALLAFPNPLAAQNAPVTIGVDAAANRHAISPYIYGVNAANPAALIDLNVSLNRYGGNNATRYNWQANADNRGNDYYFESIPDASAVAGERGDTFFSNARSANAQAMLTVPTLGWIAKVGSSRNKLSSFSIAKYGAQTGSDSQWFPDAGNGVSYSTKANIVGNNPNDANVPSTATVQQAWIQHIVGMFGLASNGGLKYYILDNEPSIWHSTHRDVHPTGATMSEIRDKITSYAAAIKSVDPGALVVGPEEWGWSGYFYSGYDQQYGSAHGWSNLPDRSANGNMDYIPWLLSQLHQHDATTGQRSLDVCSVHYYPQGGEYQDSSNSTAMQLLRNRSTRALWDPSYVDQSWINTPVQLVPRIKGWVNSYYPGLQTALTEYNWGGEGTINGATTQADILGILGREGLDFASRWTVPSNSSPTYKAFKLYRNYDGNRSTFGDSSVSAIAPDPDNVAAFAATRTSDGALTVMVINKVLSGSTPVTVNLANFAGTGTAQAWQLSSTNAITHLPDVTYTGSSCTTTMPAQSVTLLVLPAFGSTPPPPPVNAATFVKTDTTTQGSWQGVYGSQGYNVLGDRASQPTFALTSVTGNSAWTWAASTTDVRALQKASAPTSRLASCWYVNYTGNAFTQDISLTDGQSHQIALYLLDWDGGGRVEKIDIIDPSSGVVLDSRTASSFNNGAYFVWKITGSVRIKTTCLAGGNAVISGLFFDAVPSVPLTVPAAPTALTATPGTNQVSLTWSPSEGAAGYNIKRSPVARGPYTTVISAVAGSTYTDIGLTSGTAYYYVVTASNFVGEGVASNEASAIPNAPAGNTATFIKADTTTQGSWVGKYGAAGYNVLGDVSNLPSWASTSVSGTSDWTWDASTTDVRALQKASVPSTRIAFCWYVNNVGNAFTEDVSLTDGNVHQVALYFLDWDNTGRGERIDVLAAATNAVLNSQTITGFKSGEYLVWNITGHVKFRITCTAATNAVISGLFLD